MRDYDDLSNHAWKSGTIERLTGKQEQGYRFLGTCNPSCSPEGYPMHLGW